MYIKQVDPRVILGKPVGQEKPQQCLCLNRDKLQRFVEATLYLGYARTRSLFCEVVGDGGDVDFGCGDEVFYGDVFVYASHAVDLGSKGDSRYAQVSPVPLAYVCTRILLANGNFN